jgi:DNA-binding NarL/FixJ family response regulator
MVQQHRPDVVLMDLMMPGFDGLEATRRIKEQWPETKILVLTSLTEDDFREVAYDSGADGFLNKLDIASRLLLAIRAVTSALRV